MDTEAHVDQHEVACSVLRGARSGGELYTYALQLYMVWSYTHMCIGNCSVRGATERGRSQTAQTRHPTELGVLCAHSYSFFL